VNDTDNRAGSQTFRTTDTKSESQLCLLENVPLKNPSVGLVQRKTQSAAILRLLIEAHSGWVPLPEIMACAAQYNSRIHSLRGLGFVIENKTERVNGVRHSWFRLVNSPAQSEASRKP
jgi:hypothetical protein